MKQAEAAHAPGMTVPATAPLSASSTAKSSAPPSKSRPQARPALPTHRAYKARQRFFRAIPLLLAGVGAVTFTVLSGFAPQERPLLPVRSGIDRILERFGYGIAQVELSGFRATDPTDLMKRIGGDGTRTLIALQPNRLRKRIEALPWISEATITRVWPDRLRIAVREKE
ncbi:MAG: FtsQ-type POTRA domain-containing protein, partial [Pseudomonadota bacterium]